MEVVVLGKGSGYDEVRCRRIQEEALDDTDFRGPLGEIDISKKSAYSSGPNETA